MNMTLFIAAIFTYILTTQCDLQITNKLNNTELTVTYKLYAYRFSGNSWQNIHDIVSNSIAAHTHIKMYC